MYLGLLRAAEVHSAGGSAFEGAIEKWLSWAKGRVTDNDIPRYRQLARLLLELSTISENQPGGSGSANVSDDTAKARRRTVRRQLKEIEAYLGFTAAAEALHRARNYADFCSILPHVDLKRLYHGAGGDFSPFPLIWAMETREKPLERVQATLNAGARLDLRSFQHGDTVLHEMATAGRKASEARLQIVRLLAFKGADLEARNNYGRTPLHEAVLRGSPEDSEVLLAAGVDVRSRAGKTVLMLACGNPEKMRLLLDYNADPEQLAADGKDLPFHLRQQLAMSERMLAEQPEMHGAGSNLARHRAALIASMALVASLFDARL